MRLLATGLKEKTITNEDVNKEFKRLAEEDIFEFKRLTTTFKNYLTAPKLDINITDLKYRKPYEKAIILSVMFGDSLLNKNSGWSKEETKLRN